MPFQRAVASLPSRYPGHMATRSSSNGPSPALLAILLVVVIAAAAGGLIFLTGEKASEAAEPEAAEEAPNPFEGLPPERPEEE